MCTTGVLPPFKPDHTPSDFLSSQACSLLMSSPEFSPSATVDVGGGDPPPHVAILPSAGMGHLNPSIRLAAALAARGCGVTFVTVQPMVSAAESGHVADLVSSFPQIQTLEFHLLPFDASTAASTDPFVLHFEAIRRSTHLLAPLLTSASPPLSALIADVSLASAVVPVAASIPLPCHILFISSAEMLALCAAFPNAPIAAGRRISAVEIPGLTTIPGFCIPPPLHNPTHLFTTQFVANGKALLRSDSVLVNTFHALEPVALAALNSGAVVPGLPPVIAIGPLPPLPPPARSAEKKPGDDRILTWLDAQPEESVVYVSFGNRSVLSRDQIRELAGGLEGSGCGFLWVVKGAVVDREDDSDLEELLGEEGFLARVEGRGMVVKEWVEQSAVLGHRAIGGFVSHAGWNSVTEAAAIGSVPMLAWARGGDQRVNAAVVRRGGLGVWVKEWSWNGDEEEKVVGREEIAAHVRGLVRDARVREAAARMGVEALNAVGAGGSSDVALEGFLAELAVKG